MLNNGRKTAMDFTSFNKQLITDILLMSLIVFSYFLNNLEKSELEM